MRPQIARIFALIGAVALCACAAGCRGTDESLPLRTISFQQPDSGPLKPRAADILRAAQLELDSINSDTEDVRLKLVYGPDPHAIANIDALARVSVSKPAQLTISLTPPIQRSTQASAKSAPRIWLLPPDGLTSAARASYIVSGLNGSRTAIGDSPLRPGIPTARQYVSPALTDENYPPAGREFFEKFEQRFDRAPDRYAIYGYDAVGLLVDAIERLEDSGRAVTQASVAKSALAIRDRFSPVGHYDVLPSGQTTLYVFQARGKGVPNGPAALIEALR
jgi:hypothetical protein